MREPNRTVPCTYPTYIDVLKDTSSGWIGYVHRMVRLGSRTHFSRWFHSNNFKLYFLKYSFDKKRKLSKQVADDSSVERAENILTLMIILTGMLAVFGHGVMFLFMIPGVESLKNG